MFPMAWVLVIRRARPHTACAPLAQAGRTGLLQPFVEHTAADRFGGPPAVMGAINSKVMQELRKVLPAKDLAIMEAYVKEMQKRSAK